MKLEVLKAGVVWAAAEIKAAAPVARAVVRESLRRVEEDVYQPRGYRVVAAALRLALSDTVSTFPKPKF